VADEQPGAAGEAVPPPTEGAPPGSPEPAAEPSGELVEPVAKKAATTRAPRKRASAPADADSAAPAQRTPRKRAAKKTAEAEPGPAAEVDRSIEPEPPESAPAPRAEADQPAADEPKSSTDAEPDQIEPIDVRQEDVQPEDVQREHVEPEDVQSQDVQSQDVQEDVGPETTPEAGSEIDAEREQGESEPDEADEDEAEQGESSAEGEEDETEESEPGRRRRRRRGGRRRRRGGATDGETGGEDADAEQPDQPADTEVAPAADETSSDTEITPETTSEEGEGQRRRRRRRRRRGEDSSAAPDDPAEVVVRVREPGGRRKAGSEVTGIDGSTRLEAKRQRRREGREAGRRRAPILSEAEFLTRRESVTRKMIIRQREDPSTGSGGALTQIAVMEDDILVEHYVDRESAASLIGNVYLGRVQNVLPSMEAAFIDIGRGRNAVLYAGEVDWDSFGAEGQQRAVERVLKSGQTVLVQVSKDPVGAKGARLTNHVSIPGRYVVYAPGGHLSGISRKLPDTERKRLKNVLSELVPESASVIVRTAAEGASEQELVRDVNRLKAQWEDIEKKVATGKAPQLLYGEPDLTVRIVRDLFTEDFSELVVAGNDSFDDAYDAIEAYVSHVAPHLLERMRRWDPEDGQDVFAAYRIDEQIAKAMERKVFLPSGGSLVIDRTEAMTVIDVNTGKFTGTGGNLEATVTSNNLEAAEEIVRQLRVRDIGGIVVIDFIDMVLPSNRELLLRRLVECLGRDRTRHQVAEVTSLGLVQMTRKRIGTGLLEAFSTECEVCHGRGYEIHDMPVESQRQADGGARDRNRRTPRRPRSSEPQAASDASRGQPSEPPQPSRSGVGDPAPVG
jgi:ribonuclease E